MSSQAHDEGMSLFLEREELVKWLITCTNESTLCFGTYPLLKSWDYNSNIKTCCELPRITTRVSTISKSQDLSGVQHKSLSKLNLKKIWLWLSALDNVSLQVFCTCFSSQELHALLYHVHALSAKVGRQIQQPGRCTVAWRWCIKWGGPFQLEHQHQQLM